MIKIILAVCFIPIFPVIYFIIRNNVKPKKNIILGVTLPHSAHNDHDTQAICKSFIKWLNMVMLPLLSLIIIPFFMQSSGMILTWYMTWLSIVLVAPFVIFAVHREKLMSLKRARNWYSEAKGQVLVDVKAAAVPRKKVSSIWFLPPMIASMIPVVYMLLNSAEWIETLLYVTFAIITAGFWLFYHLIYRLRSEVVNDDSTLTMALTRIRRYNWSKFWITASWLTGFLNLLLWVFAGNSTAFLIATLGYTIILIVAAMQTELAARMAQQKLTAEDTGNFYLDEDEYWIFGMLYYNPNDKHFLVNDRIGTNMSANLARPAAKVLMAFAVLCIVAMPFFGVWMWTEEITPATLILSETALTAHHTSNQYVIELSDIESIELLVELPVMTRTMGTGLDNLYKGRFNAKGYGAIHICLQPKNPPFLIIKTNDKTYFLNDADDNVTREIYASLR